MLQRAITRHLPALAAGLAVSLAPALAGCSGSSSRVATPTTVTGSVGPTTTVSPATALAGLLVVTVPAGYVQQPDSVGQTGPSDLAKAVSDDGQPDAQAVLTKDGFVAGYQRLWQTSDQHQLVVFLYQFSSASGAAGYEQRSVTSASKGDAQTTVTPYAVSGIPGASGFAARLATSVAAVVLFTKGDYLVQVASNGGTDPVSMQSIATSIALEQAGRLS